MSRGQSISQLAVLFLTAFSMSGQEWHYQTQLHSGDAAFSVTVPAAVDMAGFTLTLRNNSGSNITFPMIFDEGAVPVLGASEIVKPLKAAAVSDEDFAIRTWQFVLDHFTHYCSAGFGPKYGSEPMQMLYGYGVGCCDQTARVLGWLWTAAGYNARIAVMNFHTVPEISYGGAWHMLDADHRTFYRSDQGGIVGVAEIFSNPNLVARTHDSEGRDPVGFESQTMADLYAANAPTLVYSPVPAWADNAAEYILSPGETAQIRQEDSAIEPIVYKIPEYNPISTEAFGSIFFRRHVDFAQQALSSVEQSSGVQRTMDAGGRWAVTAQTSTGSLTFYKKSPFPITSLRVNSKFEIQGLQASVAVRISTDGLTWSEPIPFPSAPPSAGVGNVVDLSPYALGSTAAAVQIVLTGAPGTAELFSVDIETEAQLSKKMLPHLMPGQTNSFRYRDLSPTGQARDIGVELALSTGRGELPIASATSLIPEDPQYSVASSYQANNLVDGSTDTLAYPASFNIDYVLTLERRSDVKQISLWWGTFGTDPLYIKNWAVYGRDSNNSSWTLLSGGEFPGTAISDVLLNAAVTQIRITADSNNWIGLYEAKVYGDEISAAIPPAQLTTSSGVHEDPVYSIGLHYQAANLTDGDTSTLAYPASVHVDYVSTLQDVFHLSRATIVWGYFGTNPIYIGSWALYGRNGSGSWNLLTSGGFPGAESTTVSLNAEVTDVRIEANSAAHWIGIYELQLGGSRVVQPVSVISHVELNGANATPPGYLADGNRSTVAYPGTVSFDYELDYGTDIDMDGANIQWGIFGANAIYVRSWDILGQRDHEVTWTPVARGAFPNSETAWTALHRKFRKLRIRAMSSNWIGIYELTVYGTVAPASYNSQY